MDITPPAVKVEGAMVTASAPPKEVNTENSGARMFNWFGVKFPRDVAVATIVSVVGGRGTDVPSGRPSVLAEVKSVVLAGRDRFPLSRRDVLWPAPLR